MTDEPMINSRVIDEDRACVGCGYNLRGLSTESRCPECATPIVQSVRGDLLRDSDSKWLDRLRFGTSLKLWNIVFSIFVGIGAGILVAVGLPQTVMLLVGLAGGALGLWASFAITTQEPRIALHEDTVTLRKVVRFCAALGFIGAFFVNVRGGSWMVPLTILRGGLGLAGVVAMFGELVYFRRFAYRIPDPDLARSTTILMWVVPISAALGVASGLVMGLMGRATFGAAGAVGTGGATTTVKTASPSASAGAIVGILGCGVGILFLVFFIWYIRLLVRYKNAFKTAATEASTSDAPAVSPIPPVLPNDQ